MDYADLFQRFTASICAELAELWIRLFEPNPVFRGPMPAWFPNDVTLMKPTLMLKQDRVCLLQHIIRGKLLDCASTEILNSEAQKVWRLRESTQHQRTLSKILHAFEKDQKQHKKTLEVQEEQSLSASQQVSSHECETRPHKLLPFPIIICCSKSPGPLFDPAFDFGLEWREYSPQGELLDVETDIQCALSKGGLRASRGRLHPSLQNSLVAGGIAQNPQIGTVTLVINKLSSFQQFLAFSVRVAVSVTDGFPVRLAAQDWSQIPNAIVAMRNQPPIYSD